MYENQCKNHSATRDLWRRLRSVLDVFYLNFNWMIFFFNATQYGYKKQVSYISTNEYNSVDTRIPIFSISLCKSVHKFAASFRNIIPQHGFQKCNDILPSPWKTLQYKSGCLSMSTSCTFKQITLEMNRPAKFTEFGENITRKKKTPFSKSFRNANLHMQISILRFWVRNFSFVRK